MRYLLLCVTTMLGFIPAAQAYEREKLVHAFFSIVMIRGYNDDGSLAYGSGVIVAPGKVLTNCHIFRHTSQPWIARGEDTYPINSIQADKWHDVCLATVESLPFPAAQIGKSTDVKKAQEVAAIGHSSGSPMPLTSLGTIKSAYDLDNGKIIRSNARFAMGASGSGLFDENGRLIGINTFKTAGHDAYYYAIPIEWLSYVTSLPAEPSMRIDGKAFWEADENAKPYFLRIAIPELQSDWPRLADIAQDWTEAEPRNTEAWYELAWANQKMGREEKAEELYRKALEIDGNNLDALYQVGLIAAERGDQQEVHTISLALANIDKAIADEFNQAAGCNDHC